MTAFGTPRVTVMGILSGRAESPSVLAGGGPKVGDRDSLGLAVVGTSFRRVGFSTLARFVVPCEDVSSLTKLRAASKACELVYVSTCNRVEIYLGFARCVAVDSARILAQVREFFAGRANGSGPLPADTFFVETGRGALEHMFAVVSSLQSLVVGECEIAGQVRRAVDRALEAGLAGPSLRAAFERAMRAAKRVRTETEIGRTPVSVASLCNRRIREHFGGMRPRVAVLIGVGDMTRKVATALAEQGTKLLFVNRTRSRAEELAARFGGEALALEEFKRAPPASIDLLVTATSSLEPIIGSRELGPALAARRAAAETRRLLVCDLGLPPDVEASAAADEGVRLVTLADLEATARENRARLEGELERARAIVADEVDRYARTLALRLLAEESVEAILAERLKHLEEADRATLRRFATHLAERIARQPVFLKVPA